MAPVSFSLPISAFATGSIGLLLGAAVGKCLSGYIAWSLDEAYTTDTDSKALAPAFASRCPWWRRVPILGQVWPGHDVQKRSPSAARFDTVVQLATGFLFALFLVAYFHWHCQRTDEVRPDRLWVFGRAVYHLVLISLLVAATGTDLKDYVIPDRITFPGIAVALVLAAVSGDLQIIHLWVDWNHPHAELLGPHIPEWIRFHRHWHGLAWSLAGLLTGSGLTWFVRLVSKFVLHQEGIGFGDVILMAMIGAFVGWQPVVIIFLFAPVCGLLLSLPAKLLINRPYVPYGPFLSLATVIVLMTWRWLWLFESARFGSIRHLFGDIKGLGILGATAFVAMAVLLALLRFYRMIPGRTRLTENE